MQQLANKISFFQNSFSSFLSQDSEARLEALRRRASTANKSTFRGPTDSEKALERQLAGKPQDEPVRATIVRPDGWKDKKKGKERMMDGDDEDEEGRGQNLMKSSKEVRSISDANGHINFWADSEQGVSES